MNQLLTREQPRQTITSPEARRGLRCESQLRVAANMLARAHPDEMAATSVVGLLGLDDAVVLQSLVAEIGDELELDAVVRLHGGSFAVRFTRRAAASAAQHT